jgi:hypothetical protein
MTGWGMKNPSSFLDLLKLDAPVHHPNGDVQGTIVFSGVQKGDCLKI